MVSAANHIAHEISNFKASDVEFGLHKGGSTDDSDLRLKFYSKQVPLENGGQRQTPAGMEEESCNVDTKRRRNNTFSGTLDHQFNCFEKDIPPPSTVNPIV
jgi:hypothetical protein